MRDRGDDPRALLGDRASELDKRGQAAASGPGDPLIQQLDRGLGFEAVDLGAVAL